MFSYCNDDMNFGRDLWCILLLQNSLTCVVMCEGGLYIPSHCIINSSSFLTILRIQRPRALKTCLKVASIKYKMASRFLISSEY